MRLLNDPRYLPFGKRYAFDVVRFAVEVCGMVVTHQQVELMQAVVAPGCRVSVRSGHGTGKTRSAAVITLWHLLCYPKSNTLITAPKVEQVRSGLWKEVADVLDDMRTKGKQPWVAAYVALEAERIYVKGFKLQWNVTAKTAPRGSPENLAGMHRLWYLVIADEASGIPDPNFTVLTGALTDARNRMLLLSQPTRASGFFYNTHHALSVRQGGVWEAIRMDSSNSPLVSQRFLAEKRDEYTKEEYTIKVLGEFPEQRDGYLLGRAQAEACFGRSVIQPGDAYGILLAVDVGAGEYRDKSVALVAHVSGTGDFGDNARRVQVMSVPVYSNTRHLQNFTGDVFGIAVGLEGCTVLVDAGGMGVAVVQALESRGVHDLKRVKWGEPCHQNRNRERFANLRAQAMVSASRAAKEGRLGIADGHWRRDLLDQMARIPYHYDEKARYVIEKKDEMRKQGIPSPDLWDAVCFCFLEGVHYNLREGAGDAGEEPVMHGNALAVARALFAGV